MCGGGGGGGGPTFSRGGEGSNCCVLGKPIELVMIFQGEEGGGVKSHCPLSCTSHAD